MNPIKLKEYNFKKVQKDDKKEIKWHEFLKPIFEFQGKYFIFI